MPHLPIDPSSRRKERPPNRRTRYINIRKQRLKSRDGDAFNFVIGRQIQKGRIDRPFWQRVSVDPASLSGACRCSPLASRKTAWTHGGEPFSIGIVIDLVCQVTGLNKRSSRSDVFIYCPVKFKIKSLKLNPCPSLVHTKRKFKVLVIFPILRKKTPSN